MTAGQGFKYYWKDEKKKKAESLSAKEYIKNVLLWVESYLDDEKVFPSNPDVPFPSNFRLIVSNIFKRMFRIYAHLYYHHRQDLSTIGIESHMNTSFRHFVFFAQEFSLISEDQYEPLLPIISKLK